MPAPTLHYLTWSKTQVPNHRHNLADSAVATPDLEAFGLPHQAGLTGDAGVFQAELERALGARL